MRRWSRHVLVSLAAVALVTAVACGSAASPNPSSAPAQSPAASKSSSAPAQSPAAASPSTAPQSSPKPAGSAAASPQSAWSPESKAAFDKLVAEAKKEGTLAVMGSTGELLRDAALSFQKVYPEIQMEYAGMKGSDVAPKIAAERNAGQYLWDVYFGGATTVLQTFRPAGTVDPLRPALLMPDVLDNSKWNGGGQNAWMDKEKQYVFGYEGALLYTFSVNRDMVPESELNTIDQLLDPRWKGKIVSRNLKLTGAQGSCSSLLLKVKGEDWLRKLFAQDITQFDDERAVVESVVRGRYPIQICVDPASVQPFIAEGLTKSLKPLQPDSDAGAGLNSGSGNLAMFNKAPHPNAAKLFANWLLSMEGQTTFVAKTNAVSRRADVKGGNPDLQPKPNRTYVELNNEDMLPIRKKSQEIAKEIFK